jgi:hypothetical protein
MARPGESPHHRKFRSPILNESQVQDQIMPGGQILGMLIVDW